ncbi:MAG: multicopper oxidase family protein [Hyalangium sp.]|uniref:multicopper oxidase family protein n=1 Tax=Hyalangium sp. TaxID=2028555 RepID=UPI00389A721A
MNPFSRRSLLKAGTGLVAGVSLTNFTGCPDPEPSEPTNLTVQFANLTLAGYNVRLRTYGGAIPGPTVRTKPGAKLSFHIDNQLPPYDSTAWASLTGLSDTVKMNIPHHLNTTNLHVHGLEVVPHLFEPVGTEDPSARMIAIEPGSQKDYTFELPDDHPTGLYWYHPHHHGSTAVQVGNGMAGLIIVKGAIDEVPEIAAAKDCPIAVQDVGLFESQSQPGVWSYDPPQNAIWDTFAGTASVKNGQGATIAPADSGFTTGDFPLRLFLVNGAPVFQETHNAASPTQPLGKELLDTVPIYKVRPGEVVRFRMLNGCSDNMIPLEVQGHTMYLLAMDGVNYPAPRERPYNPDAVDGQEQVLLAPGGRAEFLIKGSTTPGVYSIMQLAQKQQFLESQAKVLAQIKITGDPMDMPLPKSLPLPKRHYPLISEIGTRRDISFDMMFPPTQNLVVGLDFAVNGSLYEETATPVQVKLGAVEEWTIHDNGHHTNSSNEGHPFHLHTNSFEVISVGDQLMEPGTIQDTVWVPHNTPVVIRIKFKEWTGKDVFHCHIIPHEDAGMMQNLLVTK